jgi:hypothetical protein
MSFQQSPPYYNPFIQKPSQNNMSVTVETPLSVPTSTSGNINGVQHIVNSLRSGLTSNDFKPVQDGSNDSYGAKDDEIHTHKNRVHVDFTEFYGIEPTQVDRRFDLTLSDLSYLPNVCFSIISNDIH